MNGPPKQVLKVISRLGAQADLRARDLAGVAGDEVVDGLVGSQPRDGRHHPGSVAGEEDDVLRMAGLLLRQAVRNVRERIGGARVFRDAVVVQVQMARERIEGHVLQDGAEPAGAGIDLRLGVGRQADDLGIAAVLEIEDAVVAPAVLVVADEVPLGIGGERRLAGSGEAEEDRHVAAVAHVGRAVHGQHAFQRQQEIQHGEDGLLDLAGVAASRR